MAYLAVDESGETYIYELEPIRDDSIFTDGGNYIHIDSYYVEKMIGRKLTWDDEPFEI